MKLALGSKGEVVEASAAAPPEAVCPDCGGVLILRHRRRMNRREVTYYWRHADNRNQDCPSRQRPV